MGWARTRLIRNLFYSLGVLGLVAAAGLGLPALNRELPSNRPVPVGQAYNVGGGVSVVPPPGAMMDVTQARPGVDRGTALFLLAGVRYALVVMPFTHDLVAAGADLRGRITAKHGYQVTGSEVATRTDDGVAGLQGGYSSSGRVGRYTVFLYKGTAVEVTLAGTDLDVHTNLAALQRSVATIRFRPAGQP